MYGSVKKGITLIELVIVIVLVGVLGMAITPIMFSGIDVFRLAYEHSHFKAESRNTFTFLTRLLQTASALTVAQDTSIAFQAESREYSLSVEGFPADSPPYQLMISIDGGSLRRLTGSIARLSDPARPGVAFKYFNQNNEETAVLSKIRLIALQLIFQGSSRTYSFDTRFNVEAANEKMY